MKPKDELTSMNQSQSLWEAGALGLKTFLTLQKVSDVDEAAEDALLWKMGVMPYVQIQFPELAAKLQQLQQGGMAQPQQGGAPPQPAAAAGGQTQGEPVATGGEPPNAALSQVPIPK